MGPEKSGRGAQKAVTQGFLRGRWMSVRLFALQAAALLFLGVVLGTLNMAQVRTSLHREVTARALSLTRSQAHNGKLGVLAKDEKALKEMIGGLRDEQLFAFAAVLDETGAVLSGWGPVPRGALREILKDTGRAFTVPPEENGAGLRLFVAPVLSAAGGPGDEGEEALFGLESGSGPAAGELEERAIGYCVTGMSPEYFRGPERQAFRRTFLAVALVVMGTLLVLGVLLSVSFRPMDRMVKMLQEIALGGGDLTRRIDIRSRDEIGFWAYWFNRFVEYLQEVVRSVIQTISHVDESLAGMAKECSPLLSGAREQISSLKEAVASMEAMDSSLSGVSESAQSLKGNMDMSAEAVSDLARNIGEIETSYETFGKRVLKINESLSEMKPSLDMIARSVEEIRSGAESTGTAMFEMSTATRSINEHIANTAAVSNRTRELAEKGRGKMMSAMEGMGAVQSAFHEVRTVTDKLQKQIGSIGEMLGTIREISDSTQLLSLNAAIIAAQAGESGKGFGVVAGEIHNLSEKTAASVKEIEEVLRAVQDHSTKVSGAMGKGLEKVDMGSALSLEAKHSLEEIAAGTGQTEEYVRHIVGTVGEQTTSTERINEEIQRLVKTLEKISQASREQSMQAQQIAEAAEELGGESARVQSAIIQQTEASRRLEEITGRVRDATGTIYNAALEQRSEGKRILESFGKIERVSEENLRTMTVIQELMAGTAEKRSRLMKEMAKFKV